MQTSTQRWLAAALVAAVVAAVLLMRERDPVEHGTVASLTTPAPAPVPSSRSMAPAPAPLPASPVLPEALFGNEAGLPLSAHVERLLATRAPADAYTAYMLVASCTTFNRRHDLDIFDEKRSVMRGLNASERQHLVALCGPMTERERLARLDYLAIAVKGGVDGAALTFLAEGPFGDPSALTTRPDDPLVREWKAIAAAQLTQAAESGDETALLVWGVQHLHGSDIAPRDPARGYGYLLAAAIVESERLGSSGRSMQEHVAGSALLTALAGQLTPDQHAWAAVLARKLADKVKSRRQHDAARSA